MSLKARTFRVAKGEGLDHVTSFLESEIGLDSYLIQDIRAVTINEVITELTVIYQSHATNIIDSMAPREGGIFTSAITSGDFDARFLFNHKIDPASIESGTFIVDNSGLPTDRVYVAPSGNNYFVKINLSGMEANTSGFHDFRIDTTKINRLDGSYFESSPVGGYVIHTQSSAHLGDELDDLIYRRRGRVKADVVRVGKGLNPQQAIIEKLAQARIEDNRLLAYTTASRGENLVDAYFIYISHLEPQILEGFPLTNSLFPDVSAPGTVTFVFSTPLDRGQVTSVSNLFTIEQGFETTTPVDPSDITLLPDGRTLQIDVSTYFTEEAIYSIVAGTGILSAAGVSKTKPEQWTIHVNAYEANVNVSGGSGAPTDAYYVVTQPHPDLDNEVEIQDVAVTGIVPTPGTAAVYGEVIFTGMSGVSITSVGNTLTFSGTSGVSDHGDLNGLADDDHTLYHTDGRADVWLTGNSDFTGHTGDATVHFEEGDIDHTNIQSVGSNTHTQIDTHITDMTGHTGDATIHFEEGDIDHTNIQNVGSNTHAAIDTHITDMTGHTGDATIHYATGSIDHGNIAGLSDDDHEHYILVNADRGFTNPVSGEFPTEDYHLTTKYYVTGNHPTWQVFEDTAQGIEQGMMVLSGDVSGLSGDVPYLLYQDPGIDFLGLWRVITGITGISFTDDGSDYLKGNVVPSEIHHGDLSGINDDDHTQYLLAVGTRPLEDDWDVGAKRLRTGGVVEMDEPTLPPIGQAWLSTGASNVLNIYNGSDWIPITGAVGGGGVSDHGALNGLDDDDHTQYVLADGSRGFSATVSGVDPTSGYHLATKDYIDSASGYLVDHTNLTNIGTNTHAQIDTHIAAITGHTGDSTIHFTTGEIDHTKILNIGVKTHAQIDNHINDLGNPHDVTASHVGSPTTAQFTGHTGDTTVHYTEATIDHTNIQSIGTNTHAAIDTHIAAMTGHTGDSTIHYVVGSIDHGEIGGLSDDDHSIYVYKSPSTTARNTISTEIDIVCLTVSVDGEFSSNAIEVLNAESTNFSVSYDGLATAAAGVNFGSSRGVSLATPISDTDAATKGYVDDNFFPNTLADALGDLFVGTGSDVVGKLPVGNDGDVLVADSSEPFGMAWVEPSGCEYTHVIWAEENAGLASASYEWAFGNGANTPNSGGVTIYVPDGWTCHAVAMTLRLGGGTATVELVHNGTLKGGDANVVVSSGQGATNTFTPLEISDGDYLNFRTTTASGTSGPCVAAVYLRYSSPQGGGARHQFELNLGAYNLTAGLTNVDLERPGGVNTQYCPVVFNKDTTFKYVSTTMTHVDASSPPTGWRLGLLTGGWGGPNAAMFEFNINAAAYAIETTTGVWDVGSITVPAGQEMWFRISGSSLDNVVFGCSLGVEQPAEAGY